MKFLDARVRNDRSADFSTPCEPRPDYNVYLARGSVSHLKQALRTALVTQFRIDHGSLDDNTRLFSSGLIDSLSVMELVSFVESTIGQIVPPAEITLENFDSVNRIVRFAEMLISPGHHR